MSAGIALAYDRSVNALVAMVTAEVGLLLAAALGLGAVVGWLLARRGPRPPMPPTSPDQLGADPVAGLGRRSVDSLRVGVVLLDERDNPVLANPASRAMGLLRAGGAPGTTVAHPVLRTLSGQVRLTGVRREVELDLSGGEAEPLGVHLRAVAVGGGMVCVEAADVSDAHRLERVRRDFVANVSHELKTPIGALQLLAEALLEATDPNATGADAAVDAEASRRFAERIQRESARLGQLVSELMELSRLQGAERLPSPEPVSVDWIVADALDRTRTAANAKQIDLVVVGTRGLTVYGKDSQLATALGNLVENAVAYSPENSAVVVSTLAEDERVDISVSDQGIGIAPQDLDRVFERFYRADQARSRSTGGTGLGLAIVKHVATNHGGRVDVRSRLGGGSTFTLRLPARPSQPGQPESDRPQPGQPESERPQPGQPQPGQPESERPESERPGFRPSETETKQDHGAGLAGDR